MKRPRRHGKKFRDRITLQINQIGRDALGNEEPNWVDIGTVAGDVWWLSERERERTDQVQSETEIRVVVRIDQLTRQIKAKDRILYMGQVFAITGRIVLDARRHFEISAGRID